MATEWSEDITVVDLTDEPALSEDLSSVSDRLTELPRNQTPHIVLNFGSVTYVNSSNLAALIRLNKQVTERGRQLRLCAVADEVWSVMLITGLDKIFRFAPDLLTAIAGLQMDENEPDTAGSDD